MEELKEVLNSEEIKIPAEVAENINDSELLNALNFIEENSAKEEEISLVNHDELFGKIDFSKVMRTFEKYEEADKKKHFETRQKKGGGLINEDYLRKLIADSVKDEMEEMLESVMERLIYQMERIVATTFINYFNPIEPSNETETEKIEE